MLSCSPLNSVGILIKIGLTPAMAGGWLASQVPIGPIISGPSQLAGHRTENLSISGPGHGCLPLSTPFPFLVASSSVRSWAASSHNCAISAFAWLRQSSMLGARASPDPPASGICSSTPTAPSKTLLDGHELYPDHLIPRPQFPPRLTGGKLGSQCGLPR